MIVYIIIHVMYVCVYLSMIEADRQKSSKVSESQSSHKVHRPDSRSPPRAPDASLLDQRDAQRQRDRHRDRQRGEESDPVGAKKRRHGSVKGVQKHPEFQGNYRSGAGSELEVVYARDSAELQPKA